MWADISISIRRVIIHIQVEHPHIPCIIPITAEFQEVWSDGITVVGEGAPARKAGNRPKAHVCTGVFDVHINVVITSVEFE